MKLLAALFTFVSVQAFAQEAPRFSCVGTEPFWNMYINKSQITFKDAMSGPEVVRIEHKVVSPVAPMGHQEGYFYVYNTETSAGVPASIVISNQSCSDYMSDNRYPFSVIYASRDLTVRGCCYKNN